MRKPPPVFFFAFANDRASETRYLRNLADEENQVRKALDKAHRAGLCHYEPRYNATADTVWEVFLDPQFTGRIAVFHFAGHAGEKEIVLETREGSTAEVHADGLADFLGAQEGLQLVFLNGCSTAPQVQALLAAQVPAVIATERDIDDKIATDLSARFYQCLGAQAPLSAAFRQAVDIVRSQVGVDGEKARRSFAPRRTGTAADWPWKLQFVEEKRSRSEAWKLGSSASAHGPAVEIPDLLPYLCDRWPQEGSLDAAVCKHRGQLPRRPLAVLLHGDFQQALDRFIDRLQDPMLPHLLHRAPLRRFGPLTFKDPGGGDPVERLGPLRRSLAEVLCGDRSADLTAMASAVAAIKSPVMIDVDFTSGTTEPLVTPELLTTWLADLAQWPSLPEGQDLIFLFRFSYHEPVASSPLLFWKKSPRRKIKDLIAKVVGHRHAGLSVAALPPLGCIEEVDIRRWVENDVKTFVREAVGPEHNSLVCELLVQKALELLHATPSKSMEELAPKLRAQLLECLQEGGV